MAYGKMTNTGGTVNIDMGDINPKQKLFCQARSRYVGYGGARGGGKTYVLMRKSFGGALAYPNLRILIVRREYPELEQSIILPMRRMIPQEIASYNATMHMFFLGTLAQTTISSIRGRNTTGSSWTRRRSSRRANSARWARVCAVRRASRDECT